MFLAFVVTLAIFGLARLLRPWPFYVESDESRPYPSSNVAGEFGKWVERQARARGLSVRGVARPVPLECPKCSRSSNYFVYPDEVCERCWQASLKAPSIPANEHRP